MQLRAVHALRPPMQLTQQRDQPNNYQLDFSDGANPCPKTFLVLDIMKGPQKYNFELYSSIAVDTNRKGYYSC